MKYNRNTQNLLRYCLLTAVLLLYQIVSLCAAETALNTTIERNSSPSASLLPPPDTTIYVHICDGVPYHFHGHTYESDSTETITLPGQASDGGDSIINLIVTEHPSPTISISANPNRPLCEGEDINITADCSCHIPIFDQSFSGLSNYWKYVLRIPCGDLCPYPDAPSPPGPPGVIISCNENAPDNVEISTRGYTLQYFPYITNVYAAGMSVKLGEELSTTTETWVGSMTSSTLDLSNPFKIIITAKGWGEEPGKITVCVDGIPQQSFYAIGNGWGSASDMYAEKILYFPAATSSSTITIKTDTIIKANGEITGYRAFIQRIQITRLCHHYSWSTGIADSNAIITVQPENNESYSVTVTNDNNCSASASYNVIVNHPQGTNDTISACNSYIWHNSTYTQSGTYYYTRPTPDLYGCIPVDTLHLTIHDNIPNAHISGNLNISEGQSTSLTVTPTGDQPYTYTWSASWSSGTSLFPTNTTNVFNTGVLNETTRYIVTVTDTNGCQSNDTAIVNVTLCENWQLVTDASELAMGDKIVITAKDSAYALSTTQRSNNRLAIPINRTGNTITIDESAQIITLEQGTVNNTFAFNVGTGYLYAASSSDNRLKTQANIDANSSWRITISNNGVASIIAQGTNTRNKLKYHIPATSGSNSDTLHLFSCYLVTEQENVSIYKNTRLSSQSDTSAIACLGYSWREHYYTESGDYSDTLTNSMGCDSIITLHLTVLHEDAATVTFNSGNGTCDTNTLTEEDCQSGITLPTAISCADNYTFAGWTTTSINAPTSILPTPLYEAGEHYNPSTDLTLYAVYKKCESELEVKYKKVTSTPPNWSGDYLIVCEEKNVAFDGSLNTLDAVSNTIAVTISGNTIESNNSTDAAKFTIEAFNGGYSILSASGKYIGNPSNSNSIATQNTALSNSISLNNDGNINIIGSGGAYLRYNAASDQTRFRYFKSSTYTAQKAIQLYRKEEANNNCEYTSYTPIDTIDMDTTVYICHYNCTGNDEAFCNLIFEDGLYDRSWRWRIWTDTEEFDTVIYRGGTYYHNYQLNGCHHVKRLVINQYEEDLEFALQEICQEDLPYHWESSISSLDTTFLEGTTSDVYVLYQSAEPCAMQMVLTLLVNNPIHTTINDTACNSYIWHRSDGSDTTITTSGHYTYSHEDINGCTQVDTLHLTINHATNIAVTVDTCDWYTWRGNTYYASGDYMDTLTDINGCTQVDTLHLTVNKSSRSDTTVITCEAIEWHGQTYTESGNYKDTLTNAAGCDSIITLHLSITEVNISINASADTICAGEVDTLWVERVSPIAIGDILCTDNSFVKPVDWTEAAAMGKVALGIVFYVDNTGEHGWAVHLHNSTSTKKWTQSSYYADISLFNYPNAREAIKDLDGYNNTQRIRTASNNTQYPADAYPAVYAVDFEHGWYLPAAGQLRLLFAERHTINASLEAVSHTQQGVTPIADTFQYWSSTECNRDEAWGVTNSLGWVRNTSKNEYNRTCSVRNF